MPVALGMVHIMPLCFLRAANDGLMCLQALPTVPLPILQNQFTVVAVNHALLVGREVVDLTFEVVTER